MYLVGDFNLNVLDYKINKKIQNFFDLMFQHGLIPVINKPTRITKRNATAIDHIITNSYLSSNLKTGIIKTDISDHFPIFLVSDTPDVSTYPLTTTIFKRYINDKSIKQFNLLLKEVNWNIVLKKKCPNKAYQSFLETFLCLYEKAFPKIKINIKTKSLLSPWMTKGLLKSSKKKQNLYDKFLKNKTNRNHLNYKTYNNLFKQIKNKSKKNYYQNLLLKYKNNIKKTWDVIKEVIGKTKLRSSILPRRLIIDNIEIIARITPIFKHDEETSVTNYRPISVLPCFSKILERIMYNRLYTFLCENNILYEKQFGFQTAHSTDHAIIQLVNEISKSFEEDKFTLGVFIDLSKAFDTVDHKILITKLKNYGIRNKNLKWFISYLSNRKQYISYDDQKTDMANITCGVPTRIDIRTITFSNLC